MKRTLRTGVVVSGLMLAACGGGGGGGGDGGSIPGPNANARFSIANRTVDFSADFNNSAPNAVQVVGSISGATDSVVLVVTLPPNGMFVNADVTINGTTGTLNLIPEQPNVLGLGTHQGSVRVQACNDQACTSQISGSPIDIQASYEVTATEITLTSATVNLDAEHRQDISANTRLSVSGGPRAWTATTTYTDGNGWLTVTPSNSTTMPIDVMFTGSGNLPGTYGASVEFTTTAGTAALTVPVTYTVAAAELDFDEASLDFVLDTQSTPSQLAQSITIESGTGADYPWDAAVDVDWITLTPTSGSTGASTALQVEIDQDVALLTNGQHMATLSLTSSDGAVTPIDLPINLTKDTRSARFVAPYAQTVGNVVNVAISGERLDTLGPGDITIGNTTVTDFEIRHENEIVVRGPFPAVAGRHAVQLTHTNGLALDDAELVLVDPVAFQAVDVPLPQGSRFGPIFDVERNCVLAIDHDARAIERYCENAGNWTVENLLPPVLYGPGQTIGKIALSVDGKELYAQISTVPDFRIARFNADTLDYIDASPDDFRVRADQMEVLNNGFVLLSVGFNNNIWNPRTGETRIIGGELVDRLSLYSDPVAASRDGSRMYAYGKAGIASEDTFFSYDTASNTITDSGITAGQRGFLRTNLDGTAIVIQEQVYDDSFQLAGTIGDVIVPSMSPNGELVLYFDTTGMSTPIYWFTAKDLRSPDGNGGYADFFPRRDVTGVSEIESGMFLYAIHPDLTTLFFVDDDKMRVVTIP
ncbi:MAG: hypothetical protein K0U72_13475 [Gammaproteobacteria bacterium]|nr:hypothetical protein [Gammaproteobacteria bacterium]